MSELDRKIAKLTGALPGALVLKGVTTDGRFPVSNDDFADVYIGLHGGKEVVLKVVRMFVPHEKQGDTSRCIRLDSLDSDYDSLLTN